jgi:hypothetical protein
VRGRIVATVADYAAVHALLDDLVAEAVDASVSAATRDTVEAVRDLLAEGNADHVVVKKIADRLAVGRSATYDRIRRALAAGFLVNAAKEGERGLKIALGAELPAGGEFLPSPAEVVRSRPDGAPGLANDITMRDSDELSGSPGRPAGVPDAAQSPAGRSAAMTDEAQILREAQDLVDAGEAEWVEVSQWSLRELWHDDNVRGGMLVKPARRSEAEDAQA